MEKLFSGNPIPMNSETAAEDGHMPGNMETEDNTAPEFSEPTIHPTRTPSTRQRETESMYFSRGGQLSRGCSTISPQSHNFKCERFNQAAGLLSFLVTEIWLL